MAYKEYFKWEDPAGEEEFNLLYEHDFLTPGGDAHYKQVEANIKRYGAMDIRWNWEDIITRYIDQQDECPTSLPSPAAIRNILQNLSNRHDCEQGIGWFTIDCYLDELEDHELLPIMVEKLINESPENC